MHTKSHVKKVFKRFLQKALIVGILTTATVAIASDVNLSMQLEKYSGNNIKFEGYLDNFTEGRYSTTVSKEVDGYLLRADIEMYVEERKTVLCDMYSWEQVSCGECVENVQFCDVQKRPGVICEGEEGMPPMVKACNTQETPTCTEESWEVYNCSLCRNGLKQCDVRKKWGVICEGEAEKPSETQICTPQDPAYCDEDSWELYNCDYCRQGMKQCDVRKKWGVICEGDGGKPIGEKACKIGDISYCEAGDWELYDCSNCYNRSETCKVRKKEGIICVGEEGKPAETRSCEMACTEESWELSNCSECSEEGKQFCEVQEKDGHIGCTGEGGKPMSVRSCGTMCTEESWELKNCSVCEGGKQVCDVKKKGGWEDCKGDTGKPNKEQSCEVACTEESWEFVECSECNEGQQTCEVEKKEEWESCVGQEGLPSEEQECLDDLIAQEQPMTTCDLDLSVAIPFQDTVGHWGESFINQLRLWGVVHGKNPGIYSPNDTLSRAEFTKIALNAFCISTEGVEETSVFPDVQSGAWYTPYVLKAKEEGIIIGYNDGLFRPDQPINRPEAIKIILETASLDIPNTGGAWYQKYISFALSKGVIDQQDEQKKAVDGTINRAEIAKITVLTKNYADNLAMENRETASATQ